MNEVFGFSLSQEELLVLLLINGLSLPVGFDNLEERIFSGLADELRPALFAVVERGLMARGVLQADQENLTTDEYVIRFLQLCVNPKTTWIAVHQPTGQAQRTSYFHQDGEICVAHVEIAGIHQFVQLNSVQDIADTATQLVDPIKSLNQREMVGNLVESIFAVVVASPEKLDATTILGQLQNGGLEQQVAELFTETLQSVPTITAFARIQHNATPVLEMVFTIVRDTTRQWLLAPSSKADCLELRLVNGPAIIELLQKFCTGTPEQTAGGELLQEGQKLTSVITAKNFRP
jgi:hypothetical protein